MKIGVISTLLLAACITVAGTIAPAYAELPSGDVAGVESGSGRPTANGGSGIAAAILCGGFSRMAVGSGMNPGITSAAIAACAYMMLDGFFDFPW